MSIRREMLLDFVDRCAALFAANTVFEFLYMPTIGMLAQFVGSRTFDNFRNNFRASADVLFQED